MWGFESQNIRDYSFLTILLGILFFVGLGNRPLSSPSEARYAEIPREMVVTKDYVTPHLNGLKYFEKPPFVYWLEALPIKLGFVSEFALRLPIALFGILGGLLCYAFGRRIYSRKTGLLSTMVLSTSLLYFALTRLILLDLVFSVFIAGSLFAFIIGVKCPAGKERLIHLILSSALVSLAVLTKGLAGLVLPGGVIAAWLVLTRKWAILKPLYLVPCLLVLVGLIAPWHILVAKTNPEFLDFYFIHEHFTRYLTTVHRRFQPFWFFVPTFFIGFMPWILFLPKAMKGFLPMKPTSWKVYDIESFLIVWAGFIFVFFSASSSKLIPYILPIFFPMAIVVGRHLANVIDNQKPTKVEAWIYTIFSCTLAYGVHHFLISRDDLTLLNQLLPYIRILKPTLVLGSFSFLFLSYSRFYKWRLLPLLAAHLTLLYALNEAGTYLQKASLKPLAKQITRSHPDAPVVTYGFYPQDLPYYLGRTVHVASWSGELDFGQSIEPEKKVFLSDHDLKSHWKSQRPLCIVSKKDRVGVLKKLLGITLHHQYDDYYMACNQSASRNQ
jgi:4-amino-4-deoxy-L-arabinose transferase-like glycosyltransferase